MLGEGVYEVLLRLALDDEIRGVVCGPNCRTRSILRHIPIPGDPTAPRPVRDWGGEEWGKEDLSQDEKRKVHEDDIMLWRAVTLAVIAIHVRRAQESEKPDPKFLIEQPAEDERFPETVALWRTEEWGMLRRLYNWKEVTFRQGDYGGKATKPTTVGGDLMEGPPQKKEEKTREKMRNSKELERWAPGMMRQKQNPHRRVGSPLWRATTWWWRADTWWSVPSRGWFRKGPGLWRRRWKRSPKEHQRWRSGKTTGREKKKKKRQIDPPERDPTEGRRRQRMKDPPYRDPTEGRKIQRLRDPLQRDPVEGRRLERTGRWGYSGWRHQWQPNGLRRLWGRP